ncbi:MAG: phosphodiesterase [Clostridiales bacterium]|nr:phosphodiesterase [Clostridiales bacterium]
MKLMIASDIHGSALYLKALLEAYKREQPDQLVLLGDLLYHGPRNDLPQGYAPKEVIALLSPLKEEILCVRGNCEAEVDQMVLPFPVMADYAVLFADGLTVYLTHGHIHGESNPPPMKKGSVLLCGHTHVPVCHRHENFTYVNPGSVSIPKENSPHSYAMLENGVMTWKDLDGKMYMEHRLV